MGKSFRFSRYSERATVHPHTCGEISSSIFSLIVFCGSPPHVWGNREAWINSGGDARFTPTRVGKSCGSVAYSAGVSVHPHTCGEILRPLALISALSGSPPHVWGNLLCRNGSQFFFRFTPTRVGKSTGATQVNATATVHPHTCGEIPVTLLPSMAIAGSPPHVWGNLERLDLSQINQRFTPTRVGKSDPKNGST